MRIPPVAEYADRIRVLAEFHDTVIVEGAGGLLVRLDTEGGTLLDLAAAASAPRCVVVAAAGLGTLNHTELTVAARSGPAGSSRSGWSSGPGRPSPGLAETCNLDDLPRVTGVPLLAKVPGRGRRARPRRVPGAAPAWFSPTAG